MEVSRACIIVETIQIHEQENKNTNICDTVEFAGIGNHQEDWKKRRIRVRRSWVGKIDDNEI